MSRLISRWCNWCNGIFDTIGKSCFCTNGHLPTSPLPGATSFAVVLVEHSLIRKFEDRCGVEMRDHSQMDRSQTIDVLSKDGRTLLEVQDTLIFYHLLNSEGKN
jgi:hypothetical protein